MEFDDYYMDIAIAVRRRANCKGRKVGAILVRENRIVSTGYNGTPEGVANCEDGGCVRCAKRGSYESGRDYDICICVHAEQNAVLTAARFGIEIAEATCFTTVRPCFNCTKAMIQSKVARVVYMHELGPPHPDEDIHSMYEELQKQFDLVALKRDDPEYDWAMKGQPRA